ncbi:hypothetical protein SAMN02910369_00877 [Lachnospiraceae bacterium NE2001]|nr:hypothetical protein SAMN02910369_00877 [Lachnospiraceae bacterium NE2001]
MALPANITGSDNNVLSIAASNNKGLLIRFLNEQVEDGFYALVIDYLKDSNFDLKTMNVDDDVKSQCVKLYELGEFVDENIKAKGRYEIDEWIEPLFKFVYGDIDPSDIDAPINTTGIYRYSVWLIYLYQREKFGEAMRLIGERIAPLLINVSYQILEDDDRPKNFDKGLLGYLDLINVVMDMGLPTSLANSDAYLSNLEVLYDYVVEDPHVGNDYKTQLSIGLFNTFIANKDYNKAFEFYGLNAEFIPIDNMAVYESFKELIRNVNTTQDTSVLSRNVLTAISKQELYNKRIDTLISEVSAFVKKVYLYIENEPDMKKNLQILGAGAQLTGKTNIFEGLYEYNLVFYECGIKELVNSEVTGRPWEEKYEILEKLYTTLNVVFDGYNVYELSNKIEHQYVEITWINDYVNANPSLLKMFFSIKEKIKAFKVRKNAILEKSKTNYEIKQMIDDRQKTLVFMAAEDMIVNGLNGGRINIINSEYDPKTAEKYLVKTYDNVVVPSRYRKGESSPSKGGGLFGRGASSPSMDNDLKHLLDDSKIEEMLLKSEWLWHQHNTKGQSEPSAQEATYSVVCLIKAAEKLLDKKTAGTTVKPESTPNKKVIITKTGKVIELSDEGSQTPSGSNGTVSPSVVDNINNIQLILKDKSEENVEYVKDYVNDWLDTLMKSKFDMDTMLSLFEAEELRTKTFQVIKKLRADIL